MLGGDILSKLAIVAVLAVVAWFWLRPRYDLRIVADAGGLRSHRGVAQAHVPALQQFFTEDVELPGQVTIQGKRSANRPLRLTIYGPLDQGAKQQIRNFLIDLL